MTPLMLDLLWTLGGCAAAVLAVVALLVPARSGALGRAIAPVGVAAGSFLVLRPLLSPRTSSHAFALALVVSGLALAYQGLRTGRLRWAGGAAGTGPRLTVVSVLGVLAWLLPSLGFAVAAAATREGFAASGAVIDARSLLARILGLTLLVVVGQRIDPSGAGDGAAEAPGADADHLDQPD